MLKSTSTLLILSLIYHGPSVGKPSSLYQFIFTYIRTNISLFKTKKVEQLINGGFVVFSIFRKKEECDGTDDPEMEDKCGRPLGLRFNEVTGDLYIVDAYFGLLTVGRHGGVATQLAAGAEGAPFRFTNSVDIDQASGLVYFTDSSTFFQRRFSLLLV